MNNKDLSVNQRIKFLIDEYSMLTQRAFAEKIGVSQSAISSLFSQRENRPGLDMLQKIAIAYPEVSLDWLLMGQGQMVRNAVQSSVPVPQTNELVQLIQEYVQVSKQLEGKKAAYRETATDLAQLRTEVQHHEAALQVQMGYLPSLNQKAQELMQAVIQQQQETLNHIRERYAAFLPLGEQAEEELLKALKYQGELEKKLAESMSAIVPLTAEKQMQAISLRHQLVQAVNSPSV
ncbi:helix-turn-helix domain-containing protein [Hymenobacter baengnokdamensis]|uniref:helix-turn-helix domain-containing protein n=1 Tax=Hymenobacter baengnokdamensis TaxID=2615203 RepID=UPI0012451A8F|nr:helix-turn-helix transcriptional regulator [Hymenobacter baengnokdamensis]